MDSLTITTIWGDQPAGKVVINCPDEVPISLMFVEFFEVGCITFLVVVGFFTNPFETM